MSNFLNNGGVLPFGLLDVSNKASTAGFNRSYNNVSLKMGIVLRCYPIGDDNNRSGITNEYDVQASEQEEDRSSTTLVYRNCIRSDGFGSIADFFEASLRVKTKTDSRSAGIPMFGQDGAIVLLLCLNGSSEGGIIIGGFQHPDRTPTIVDNGPRLEGEFNGVNIAIETDGSCTLTKKGATDNNGDPIDSSIVPSTVKIDASGNITVNCTNATVVASDTATLEAKTVKLGALATESAILGNAFKEYFSTHTHATSMGPSLPPTQAFPDSALSTKVKVE